MYTYHDYPSLDTQARKAEQANDWQKAAELWRLAGCPVDAAACQMIHDSNVQGDQYRQYILDNAGPEPEVIGPKDDSISWMNWYRRMEKAAAEFWKLQKKALTLQ